MSLLLRIAERVLNRPLLIHPDKVPLILGVLEGRIPVEVTTWREEAQKRIEDMPEAARTVMRGPRPDASRFAPGETIDTDPTTGAKTGLPYRRHNGVAMIEIIGTLINRGAWVGSDSGQTSYEGLKFQFDTAAADPRTRAVLLDIESPGGEAVGAFEIAAAVRALAAIKPVTAVVNGMAASAAYAIASGASRIVTAPTGVVGSIGVVMLHADYSNNLKKRGIKPTLIHAGDHKVDGNPYEPLSSAVHADMQAEVDQFYAMFLETVAASGRMSVEEARATQARTFIGADAVAMKLADRVGSFDDALAELSRAPQARILSTRPKGVTMTDVVSKADHDAALAKRDSEHAAALAKAQSDSASTASTAAASNERARVLGIASLFDGRHADLCAKLQADGAVSVEQAAVRLVEADKAVRAQALQGVKDVEAEAAGKVPASPAAVEQKHPAKVAAATPEGWKAEFEASTELQAEFMTAERYVIFKKAETSGRVKILRKG